MTAPTSAPGSGVAYPPPDGTAPPATSAATPASSAATPASTANAPGTGTPSPATTPVAEDPNAHSGAAVVVANNGYTGIDPGAAVTDADTDGDGLTDAFEKLAGTKITSADSDSDGLTDSYEALRSHTDPLAADTDKDGIADAAEIAAGTDAGAIPGVGGVSGLGEHAENVRAGVLDTDKDGLTDPYEMQIGSNPRAVDTDRDGLADNLEVSLGTSPTSMDTDKDGLTDGTEVKFGTDPTQMNAGTGPAPAAAVAPAAVAAPVISAPAVAPAVAAATPPPATAPAAATSANETAPATGGHPGESPTVKHMLDEALKQVGDQYVFGAEADVNDPDPKLWDCAELTKWAAHQGGADIPGSSFEQYLDLKAKGLLIPIAQAEHTPGALVFHFSSEPQPGGGRPEEAHVAMSLGDGRTVEAQSEEVGVITDDNIGGRFEYAALLPGVDYGNASGGHTPTELPAATAADPGVGGTADATGLTQDEVIYGIRMQESKGDYHADNPTSTASGAYQYIDGTWDNYKGYSHASDAPPAVQDEKMRADTKAAHDKLGDWERVIAAHFSGEDFQEGPKSNWDRVPGYASNENPSVWEYVHGVEKYIKDADPSMFGKNAAALPADTTDTTGSADAATVDPAAHIADPQQTAQHLVDAALSQKGDPYKFGAEAKLDDPNPTDFDRSALTQWAAHQAGIEIPDTSAEQYLDLKAKGLLIPVEKAAQVPGALLFTFSSEPTAGGERPTVSHVAISQGNGLTVEADDAKGVTAMDIGSRFQYAAVLPGLQGVTAAAPATLPAAAVPAAVAPAAPVPAVVPAAHATAADPHPVMSGFQIDPGVDISKPDADSDHDGLTNHFESMIHTNPTVADTDMDGLIDGFEASLGTDPTKMDTDMDGFTDGMEVHYSTNPLGDSAVPAGGHPLGAPFEPDADPGAADHLGSTADTGIELH